MKDLSLHLLDIIENSARAGATRVDVTLSLVPDEVRLRIADNGPGLPGAIEDDPTDPFRTTRRERRVGLGLSLLRQTAEEAGGTLTVDNAPGRGLAVTCRYDPRHIDAKPPGDLTGAVMSAVLAWPRLRLVLWAGPGDEPALDSELLRGALEEVPLSAPPVQKRLADYLDNVFADLLKSCPHWSRTAKEIP